MTEQDDIGAYWVVGGRYASTEFDKLAPGAQEERYGPFQTYAEAETEWQRLSWLKVDDCQVRYRIVEDEEVRRA